MFIQFLQQLPDVIEEAKTSPHIERGEQLFPTIEAYVKKHQLIISAPQVLIGEAMPPPPYTVYGENIARHAIKLADIIAALNQYTTLYTTARDADLSITVDQRLVVQLYGIRENLIRAIRPQEVDGLYIYPPEFELIEVYHSLYSPHMAGQWDQLRQWEAAIVPMMRARRRIVGGAVRPAKRAPNLNAMILNWLKSQDYILIGGHAVDVIAGRALRLGKMQIIIESDLEQFANEFDNLIHQITGQHTTRKIHPSNFQVEPRLVKMVISVPGGAGASRRGSHLLDVFNNTHYELVPYVVLGGVNIADADVLRMFFLIEMWFLRVLRALGYIDPAALKRGSGELFADFDTVQVVNVEPTWAGVYSDIVKYRKKMGLGGGFPPFVPAEFKAKHGHWRSDAKKKT